MKLNNQEIWLAYPNLEKLAKSNLPARTSLAVATLLARLIRPYTVIETERQKLVRKWGKVNPKTNTITVGYDDENAGDFAREYGELLATDWGEDIVFEKVKLPDKVYGTCEKCGHTTEFPFLYDANSLLPLRAHLIE